MSKRSRFFLAAAAIIVMGGLGGCGSVKLSPQPEKTNTAAVKANGATIPAGETGTTEGKPAVEKAGAEPGSAGILPAEDRSFGAKAIGRSTDKGKEKPRRGTAAPGVLDYAKAMKGVPRLDGETAASPEESAAFGGSAGSSPKSGMVSGAEPPASPGVKAGFHDDNVEFGAFLDFMDKYLRQVPVFIDVTNRVIVQVRDRQGKPASWAQLEVKGQGGATLAKRTAYADGRAMFFPSENQENGKATVEVTWKGARQSVEIDPQGRKTVDILMDATASIPPRVPVDICFLLDTTGSMADEIQMLKETLESAHYQLANLKEKPDIRFGMVLYKDRKDVYTTMEVPFTGDVGKFREVLQKVTAGGGGDEPEALAEGLGKSLLGLKWREGALRVIFILTDAPPKVYKDETSYTELMQEAAERGIKIVGIGASGLRTPGEVALRQMAEYTMGWFVFLTYGERGESEGGTETSVSHHTGANWQVKTLDGIIVRFVRQELAGMAGEKLAEDDWLETTSAEVADQDKVLGELFDQGVQRLLDYSLVPLENGTPTAVAPMTTGDATLKKAAERLKKHLELAAGRQKPFKLVERANLRQLMEEQALGLTGALDENTAAKVGKLVGAKLMLISSVGRGEKQLEVFLKLVKVETSEILSQALLKVTPGLVK